jgi:ribosome maturation factor RimP
VLSSARFKQSNAVGEKWVSSPLFYCAKGDMTTTATGREAIEMQVEAELARELPEVDLREVQVVGSPDGGTLRVVIDHARGVDHELCALTTRVLDRAGLLERFSIEVSSPGPEPPLRTLEHFRQAVGSRVSLTVSDDPGSRGRRLTGTLTGVDADHVEIASADGPLRVPAGAIRRARVVEGRES